VRRLARGCRVSARHVGIGPQYFMRLRVHPRRRTPTSNISTHPYSTLGPMSSVCLVVSAAKRLAMVHTRLTMFDASVVSFRPWFRLLPAIFTDFKMAERASSYGSTAGLTLTAPHCMTFHAAIRSSLVSPWFRCLNLPCP
jgi:hypothetical protein